MGQRRDTQTRCILRTAALIIACGVGTRATAGLVTAVDIDVLSAGDKLTSPTTLGWEFVANAGITVTHLGWYDTSDSGDADGFAQSHDVGLWTADGVLLSTATLAAGVSGVLDGGFRFVAITPVTLNAGVPYVIGGTIGSTDPALRDGFESLVNLGPTEIAIQPQIALIYGRQRIGPPQSALAFPTHQIAPGESVFGANFAFVPAQSVPEPSSVALALIGAASACGLCRQRRRKAGTRTVP